MWTATARDPSRPPGIASSGPQAWSDGVGKKINTAMRVIGRNPGPLGAPISIEVFDSGRRFVRRGFPRPGPLAWVGSTPGVRVE